MFITFHGKLENDANAFYENLAGKESYLAARSIFLELAKENIKHKNMILRTYREIISDAFEGGFPLNELNEKDYELKIENKGDIDLSEILKTSVELEKIIKRFCEDASRSINGLLEEVSQAFTLVATKKNTRIMNITKLNSTL